MRRRASIRRAARRRTLVAALAALALTAGVVVPTPREPVDPATLERAAGDLAALAQAFNAYGVDTGHWPVGTRGDARAGARRELTEVDCLMSNTHALPGWSGPYLDLTRGPAGGSLVDPWGRPYLVFYLPRGGRRGGGTIRLYCAGPDRRLDSGPEDVAAGRTRGDDLAVLVTHLL